MFCPNCGSKLEDDANFCTNCGYKIGTPLTGAETPAGEANTQAQASQQGASDNGAQAQANYQAAAGGNTQANQQAAGGDVHFQASQQASSNTGAQAQAKPKRDWSLPLIDNEKLPAGIRNMPAHNFNALALIGAIVGLVLGLISLVFLIPVNTDIGDMPLVMRTGKGAIAIYVIFLLLFIAGLVLTVTTEVLGGIHWARKADYRGLVAVLIANFVEFIMMFVMIPTLNFFSKVSTMMTHESEQIDYIGSQILNEIGISDDVYIKVPSIAAGIVMIVISIAVIVVIAKFTAPDSVDKGSNSSNSGSIDDPVETVNI